jgi:NAD(P)-dependent dehydrogenase (short-subunit alcohol dehydrogenase family)
LTISSSSVHIKYLINNAGINATPEQTSLDITAESLREHIDVNVAGPAETLKTLLPYLGKGSVVLNMTSGLGSCGKKLYALRSCQWMREMDTYHILLASDRNAPHMQSPKPR